MRTHGGRTAERTYSRACTACKKRVSFRRTVSHLMLRPGTCASWVPICSSLQKSVKVMFKNLRYRDVISSSVSGLRGASGRAGVPKPEMNSSAHMVKSECVYK